MVAATLNTGELKRSLTTENLIEKYNVPAPRYTSYPTVPFWDTEVPTAEKWLKVVARTFAESNTQKGISVYLHLPFCEALCTYCGCNTRFTKNHKVEEEYIETLLAEWQIYLNQFTQKPIIRELHLGGGTPTFFSPANLTMLLEKIFATAYIHPEHEFSFEGHPNNTTTEHLQALYNLGFRRVSYGIQDFDPLVQLTINRIQPYENVKFATEEARRIGYESVNFDLIYGLPHQSLESVARTIDEVATLRPDRIAFYSYAHVPWVKPGQRSYSEKNLPDSVLKRKLYKLGLEKLSALGYADVGMDHFALPHDPLFLAQQNKTLHRNFMGYTTCQTDLLIGLGASSISDAKYGYLQNLKKVEDYKASITQGELSILKGHFLTRNDLIIKEAILALACQNKLLCTEDIRKTLNAESIGQLIQMAQEGLVSVSKSTITVTELGKAFIRNICMIFDQKLRKPIIGSNPTFSKAI